MNVDRETLRDLPPREVRELIRRGEWRGPTAGVSAGYAQANLVIVPRDLALDFLLFCQRNPRPCPVLEVTDPGNPRLTHLAQDTDLRTDVPGYRVYERGVLAAEVDDLRAYWREDLMAFLLGCSFTFETALVDAGVPVRHLQAGRNVPMYATNTPCLPAGRLRGPLVMSMRPIPRYLVVRAVQVTSRFPAMHGAPIHLGAPEEIGIADLQRVDWGDPPMTEEGDVPVFWACGVTPQAAAMASKPELMITHQPGRMFVSDVPEAELCALP